MKNKMWRATLTAAAMALNFFTAAADGSTAAPRQTQRKNNTAAAEERAHKQRRELIRKIIAEVLEVDIRKVTPEAHFVDTLGGHSLSLAECRFKIEESFRLEIPEKDAQKLMRVRDVFAYVETHVKSRVRTNLTK